MSEEQPEPALPFDGSNPEHVAAAEKVAVRKDKLRSQVLAGLMQSTQGRAWIFWLLGRCGIYRTSFAGPDALAMAFNEGRRDIGLILVAELMKHAPHAYLQMMKESADG